MAHHLRVRLVRLDGAVRYTLLYRVSLARSSSPHPDLHRSLAWLGVAWRPRDLDLLPAGRAATFDLVLRAEPRRGQVGIVCSTALALAGARRPALA